VLGADDADVAAAEVINLIGGRRLGGVVGCGGGVEGAALFESGAEGVEVFAFDGWASAGLTECADPAIEFVQTERDQAQGARDEDKGEEEDGQGDEDQESENETDEQAATWRGGGVT